MNGPRQTPPPKGTQKKKTGESTKGVNREETPSPVPGNDGAPEEPASWERPVTNQDAQRQVTNAPPAGDTGLSEEQIEGA